MDSQFAFVGSDFVVVVADTTSVQQIIVQKSDEDKIVQLDAHKVLALSGPKGDCLLYTSPSPRDQRGSRMPSSA